LGLFVYTRHTADCAKNSDRFWKRCHCPKWIRGVLDGAAVRESADTRSWEKAEERRRLRENDADEAARARREGESPKPKPQVVTISAAITRFLASKRNENLAESTIEKLTTIFKKQFLTWADSVGFRHLDELSTAQLEAFRDTWKDGALAKKKKQERLVGFFFYCMRLGWIRENPAALLGRIKADGPPTDYFTREEFDRIIDSTYIYQPKGWKECRNQASRLRVLTWLMRWSGLAIRDAVTLERWRVNDKDELFLYRAKTGSPVYVPLPDYVADALREVPLGPKPNPRYFFWSGNGSPKSAVGDWQRSFRRLFDIANIQREDGSRKRCHPHMLRDTFAIEMLLAGVPLEQVSILLGHKSVKITEKHYAPWVKARQEQLSTNVRKAWQLLGVRKPTSKPKKAMAARSA
jgi:integrase